MQPSDSDIPPTPWSDATDSSSPHPPLRHPRRAGGFAPIVVLFLLVAVFAAVAANRGLGFSLPFSSSASPPVPANWQTYRDPAGLFAIRLPPNWTVHFDSGTTTFGDRTGSATEITEEIRFSDPAQGDASPWIFIVASPIHTDFERHWYCQAFPNEHDSFHGLPAQSMDDVEWIFETGNAHFQIDYGIPGVNEPPHSSPIILTPVPTATPLPASTVAADQTLANTILGSFQPTDSHALAC